MSTSEHLRKIQSFVRREGRITPAQKRALESLWSKYGLALAAGELNFAQTFGREAEAVLEIGFGMGEGLLHYAKAEPEKNFIGIEVHRPGVGALLNHLEDEAITNVRVYQEDAIAVLNTCIPDDSLARLQLFFPDPWPKKRHHKRRIVQANFITLAAKKLKPGGLLHLATDWENYAWHMLEVCEACPALKNIAGDKQFITRPESRPLTRFEQRGLRLGHQVWDLQYRA